SDGTLNCPSTCVDSVTGGASLTLNASPSVGSTFSGWSGACSGTQPSCTLTVNASTAVSASFAAAGSGGSPGGGGAGGGGRGGGGGGGGLLTLLGFASLVAGRRAARLGH